MLLRLAESILPCSCPFCVSYCIYLRMPYCQSARVPSQLAPTGVSVHQVCLLTLAVTLAAFIHLLIYQPIHIHLILPSTFLRARFKSRWRRQSRWNSDFTQHWFSPATKSEGFLSDVCPPWMKNIRRKDLPVRSHLEGKHETFMLKGSSQGSPKTNASKARKPADVG